MKKFTSTDAFVFKKEGRVYIVNGLDIQGIPAAGERVLIDGTEREVKKVETMKCMCGNCSLAGAILIEGSHTTEQD